MDENGGTKMVGTLEFLSFEVAGGKGVYTAKTDIWGVGCLIIEMLDGQRPYKSIGLESWAASMAVGIISLICSSCLTICIKGLQRKTTPSARQGLARDIGASQGKDICF